ncbi:hypothetical protein UFOVP35_67 [uncultured Caudovirales phage]|uniref:Terminase small subunit n=1 Tax=uncultured Caudovirales phage TaxID=2100421 RepID=A0A6J7WPX6_9CAUD|nr:hypothetical protein UFOVP35_67 [uncultured Caudovirales phage]CAB4124820.1 hypothetical protein UFOVP52_56 [uncultured Caudovirales phage]CAB5219797.1 hypothetical protein UFOVP234_4 [uncultured Caudovirales phage]
MATNRTRYPNKEDICDQVIAWVSDGNTLREFCRKEEMPSYRNIYDWLEADQQFASRFARARELGHDIIAEEALRIADTPIVGIKEVTSEDGMTVTREDMLGHRKLQIETRLKLLAKWNPKKWGERTTLAGDKDAPLKTEINFEIFGELLKNIELKRLTDE